MLKHISSSSFTEAVAVLTVGHYLVVGLLFYRSDIIRLLRKRNEKETEPGGPAL